MARRINVIVAHDAGLPGDVVSAHLAGCEEISVSEYAGSVEQVAETVRHVDADLLIVESAPGVDEGLALVQWWHSVRPGRPVIVLRLDSVTSTTDPEFVSRAFGAGADDVVVFDPQSTPTPQTRQHLEFAIRKAGARVIGAPERAADSGTLIGVLGPKGGTGKTLTSTNLAVALARRGRRTVLVDIDLQFGDVALSLGLNLDRTLFDLAVSGGSLDAEKLDDFTLRHQQTGLRVLAAPARPDQAASVTPDMLKDVFRLLRAEYDFVVVDTPPYFSSEVISTIDASTHLCMLGMLDALSLKNTRLGIETLDLMGYDQNQVKVVLNRANSVVGISEQDVVAILGRIPDILIPSSREVVRSVNEGAPVVVSQPKSEMAKSFEALADLFVTRPSGEPQVEPHSAVSRSFGLRRRRKPVTAAVSAGETFDGTP
jgi:pilus assembly protein CpaE